MAWLQYSQMGFVSLTLIVKTGISVASAATGMNPDLIPTIPGIVSSMGVQGLLNVDWTTE